MAELLADYGRYWQAPGEPFDGSGTPGAVTAAGKQVLGHDDKLIVRLHKQLSANPTQLARAYTDSPNDPVTATAHRDALGPVLGSYLESGITGGKLPLTTQVLENVIQSTSVAKKRYLHPRPFTDRATWLPTEQGLGKGHNSISPSRLDVTVSDTGTGSNGTTYSADLDYLRTSGSFPSGHSSDIYSQAVPLAAMLPELAPQILVRASEYANNRVVLGVHYPLDLIGGRVAGTVFAESFMRANPGLLYSARQELRRYLAARCSTDGYGSTLDSCLRNTHASTTDGYVNYATDDIATSPVTDRASALKVFEARLTYGFGPRMLLRAAASRLRMQLPPRLQPQQTCCVSPTRASPRPSAVRCCAARHYRQGAPPSAAQRRAGTA